MLDETSYEGGSVRLHGRRFVDVLLCFMGVRTGVNCLAIGRWCRLRVLGELRKLRILRLMVRIEVK